MQSRTMTQKKASEEADNITTTAVNPTDSDAPAIEPLGAVDDHSSTEG